MLLIIAHHYVVNSGLTAVDGVIYTNPSSWRSLFLLLFGAWGKTGINCFVFITGYFMCRSKITAKKFVRLILEIELYNLIFSSIFLLSGYEPFSFIHFIKDILPIKGVAQGFTSCFLLFYLLIPFLNILVHNMTEKQHLYLLSLISFMYIIFGTIPGITVSMNYVSWFCVLYFTSSYIRLYPKKLFEKTKLWGVLTILSVLVSMASVVGCRWLAGILGDANRGTYYLLSDSNKLLAFLTALCAFLFFKNVRMKNNKWINTVAASTFGVLCIHANSDAMRQWLWEDTLGNVGMYDSPWLILHAVGSVLSIFAVCVCIDHVRIVLLEKPFFRFWDKKWEQIRSEYKKFEEKLFMRMNVKQ